MYRFQKTVLRNILKIAIVVAASHSALADDRAKPKDITGNIPLITCYFSSVDLTIADFEKSGRDILDKQTGNKKFSVDNFIAISILQNGGHFVMGMRIADDCDKAYTEEYSSLISSDDRKMTINATRAVFFDNLIGLDLRLIDYCGRVNNDIYKDVILKSCKALKAFYRPENISKFFKS